MGEQVSGTAASGKREMLDAIMSRCTSDARFVRDGEYVAFRRRGLIYAARISSSAGIMAQPLETREERGELDRLCGAVGSEIVECLAVVPANGFISSYHFERRVEYDVPEGARYVRRGGGRIKFFAKIPPGANDGTKKAETGTAKGQRRRFTSIPSGAVKFRSEGTDYEWCVPDGNSGYAWAKYARTSKDAAQ